MELAGGHDRPLGCGMWKYIWRKVLLDGFRSTHAGATLVLVVALASAGCASGPQVKSIIQDSYSIEAIEGTSRQTIGNVTIEDVGEAHEIVTPMQVQACDGPFLITRKVKKVTRKGKEYIEERPVLETVDPLQGIYVRSLKIRNDTEHTMRLNRIDAVLVDAAGNDNELMTKSALAQDLFARRPCPSTESLIENLRIIKLLGADIRIRPGRVVVLFAAFSGVDKRIIGDWTLELNEVPILMNPNGEVSRVSSFKFPLLARGYRTTIVLKSEGLFEPWEEIRRRTVEINEHP